MDELPAVLTADTLGERWGLHPRTVVRMWRRSEIPDPINPQAKREWRWSRVAIEAFEAKGAAA